MIFQEPKVEFVEIDLESVIVTSTASGENCLGTDAPANNCSKYNMTMVN